MESPAKYITSPITYPTNNQHFTRHEYWTPPTGNLVRQMLEKAGFSQSQFAKLIGVDSRAVRRWVADETQIPYLPWAILCDYGGHQKIWDK